jgi:hypothetical protein
MSSDPAHRIAGELERRGLGAPARLLADAHRPLAPLLADIGVALGPLARAVGGSRIDPLSRWLEEPDALDRLVMAIDEEREPHAEPG